MRELSTGKTLVDLYYEVSPSLANFTARHDFVRKGGYTGLVPLMALSYVALYTSPAEKAFLFTLMNGVVITWFINRGRSRKVGKSRVS